MSKADRIWTISRYTRDRTCKINQLNLEKFQIAPCTVDVNIFTTGPKPQDLLEQYNLVGAKILMKLTRNKRRFYQQGLQAATLMGYIS